MLAKTNDGDLYIKKAEQPKQSAKTFDKLRKKKEAEERNRIYQQNKDILDRLKSVEEKIKVLEGNKTDAESQLCDPVILKDSEKVQNLMIHLKKYNQELATLIKTHKELNLEIEGTK